ncbi:hypothetical protein ACFL2K_04805, partial [Candidatus Margulisiibacteriota bacterium]
MKHKVRIAVRYLLILFIFVFVAVSLGIGFLYRIKMPHKIIKEFAVKEIRKALQKEVEVGELSGNLITSVKIQDIRIPRGKKLTSGTIIKINELVAHFSLWKFLKIKTDFLGIISNVYLTDIDVQVIRDNSDYWDILHVLPPPPEGMSPPPLTFRGKVFFNNLNIAFKDEKGWAKEDLKVPFRELFSGLKGIVNYANLKKTKIKLHGIVDSSKEPISVSGFMNSYNMLMDIHFIVPKLSVNKWSKYVFPFDNFIFSDNFASINGHIISKEKPKPREIPFFYDLDIELDSVNFLTPLFSIPFQRVKAKLALKNDGMVVNNYSAHLNSIPIQGKGNLDFQKGRINLTAKTRNFKIEKLKAAFPVTKSWKYQGIGYSNLKIKGKIEEPVISGRLYLRRAKIYAFKPTKAAIDYSYYNKKLLYEIKKAALYEGNVTGNGIVDFQYSEPKLTLDLFSKGLKIKKVFPEIEEDVTGNFNFSAKIKGNIKKYD